MASIHKFPKHPNPTPFPKDQTSTKNPLLPPTPQKETELLSHGRGFNDILTLKRDSIIFFLNIIKIQQQNKRIRF